MKLPKPGKLKIPEAGAGKAAGFHIRNRFLQKNLLSLAVAAVLAIGTGTVYGTLSSTVADRGTDSVNGVNQDRYQVLVSGEGFKLSKKQEKDYKLQKKQNETNAANAMQNPQMFRTSSGSRIFRSGSSYRYRYNRSSFKTSKNPRLSSDISSEINKLDHPVKGDVFKIRVSAYAYPYGTKNAIESDQVRVSVEGGSATLYKSKAGSHYYKIVLGEGKNKVTITATDKKNKKTAKLGPYIVKAGAGSGGGSGTDPTDPTGPADPTDPELNLPVTASADLSDLGLGTVPFDGVVLKKDTTAFDVLSKIDGIKMNGQDIEYISGDFDHFSLSRYSSSELQSIYRKECDVSGDIEESEYEAWLDEVEHIVKDSGRLGTGYPFSKTRWTYDQSKTGEDLANAGISLTLILYDD